MKGYALDTKIYEECITKSSCIKSDNSSEWWREKGKLKVNKTENINTYDPNKIETEWWTEEINN